VVTTGVLLGTLVAPAVQAQVEPDTATRVSMAIRNIRFERHNVFTSAEATSFLPRLVNKLHVRTREGVIGRELLFRVGDLYDSASVAETERNLRRMGIFSEVSVDTSRTEEGLQVDVTTRDGWSTTPQFTFRTTGNQITYRLALVEDNLLGTASLLAASYRKDPDRSTVLFVFAQPRLVAGRIGLSTQYENRSDGYIVGAQVNQPFRSLGTPTAWGVGVQTRDETILRYFSGEKVAGDTVQRLLDLVGVSYGWAARADSRGYLRLGVGGRVWKDDFIKPGDPTPTNRKTYGILWGNLEWRQARFFVTRGFRANREEDVDLSTTIATSLTVTPAGFGYDENGIAPGVVARTGTFLGANSFAYIDVAAHGRFASAGLDSGSVQTGATLVVLPSPGHAIIAHGWLGWLHNSRPGGEFDLGLGVGPRGYRLHSFTGDRGMFATAEYRYMAAENFLNLADMGIAGFVDYGGAWYAGEPRRLGWDFGVGLRIGTSRSTDLLLNRFDLVRRVGNEQEPSGWVIVIGKGLVFSSRGILNQ
jgi:hypothetical protein